MGGSNIAELSFMFDSALHAVLASWHAWTGVPSNNRKGPRVCVCVCVCVCVRVCARVRELVSADFSQV